MFFGTSVCMFSLVATAAGAGADDISVFIYSYSLKASSVICKDLSRSNNASILFVLLELILVPLHSLYYMCFVFDR